MESLRFDHSFEYSFNVDSNISHEIKIPSMVIQPHIENAIWHGLQHSDHHGSLNISFRKNNGYLEVIIDDNGIGREKAMEYKSKSILKNKSYGSKISEDRVKLFNNEFGDAAIIEFVDKKDKDGNSEGTKVIIKLVIQDINPSK